MKILHILSAVLALSSGAFADSISCGPPSAVAGVAGAAASHDAGVVPAFDNQFYDPIPPASWPIQYTPPRAFTPPKSCTCTDGCKCTGTCPGCCPAAPVQLAPQPRAAKVLSYADGYAAAQRGLLVTLFVGMPVESRYTPVATATVTELRNALDPGEYMMEPHPSGRVKITPIRVLQRPFIAPTSGCPGGVCPTAPRFMFGGS